MEEGNIDRRVIRSKRNTSLFRSTRGILGARISVTSPTDMSTIAYGLLATYRALFIITGIFQVIVGQVIFSRCGCVYVARICVALESSHDSARVMTTSIRHRWIYVQLYFLPCQRRRAPAPPLPFPPPHKLTTDYICKW